MHIVVLTHAREPRSLARDYILGLVAEQWRAAGHRLEVMRGVQRRPPADLVINHVDLTRVPRTYSDFLASYPKVLNGAMIDISKRTMSRNLLTRDEPWRGAVIVKTDANCRGWSESILTGAVSPRDPWRLVPHALSARLRYRLARRDSPFRGYRVYPSLAEVPPRVWSDERLVVERFLPERDGDTYLLRKCFFLGDHHANTIFRSTEAVVRGATSTDPREEEPPAELLARRRELRLDYGRIDYVIVDGQVVIYDVNKTPSYKTRTPRLLVIAAKLAAGLVEP
jgi:hypothetical protein